MRHPLLSKFLAITAVIVLLMVVLLRIDWLVQERQSHQHTAIGSVEASLAGSQTLLGPLLVRHCTESWEQVIRDDKATTTKAETRRDVLVQVPAQLTVDGQARSLPLQRGLFKVNTYAATLALEAHWTSLADLEPRQLHRGSRVQCGPAHVMLATTDARGIRQVQLQLNGHAAAVQGGTLDARWGQGLHSPLGEAASASPESPLRARLQVELVGTQRLAVIPAAGHTQLALRSDWPHPAFGGRFLPVSREVGGEGFVAHWAATEISSSAASALRAGQGVCEPSRNRGQACLDSFEVSFFDPVNAYTLTDRATKYALLFIVLTFAAVAMAEVLGARRVHPAQYTLVGLALALFYLLLLSLSEHIPFARAYAAASGACVLLLGYYASHMFGRPLAGAAFAAGMALLYGLLWVLLQAEQTALVVGSVLLFAVLSAVMVLTRRLDWYALSARSASRRPEVADVPTANA